jgi:KUP system potassium uptake protein
MKPGSSTTQRALVIGALGVVYGDIGTSPLYAMRECLASVPGAALEPLVLGSLSLLFWAVTLVISLKYLLVVTRADNQGEGGIFALLALTASGSRAVKSRVLLLLVLAGAALLFGDGVITPAISVVSAAEGLKALHPDFDVVVVPIACVVLVFLFWFQKHGSGGVGRVFGPVMVVWFLVLGLLGLVQIVQSPGVLLAVNPWHAVSFVAAHPGSSFHLICAVVLAITGAEALYADMGHFGRKAICRGWFLAAYPGLLLNYFGQGALALRHPETKETLFFELAPSGWPQMLLVLLAFWATGIASQAMITGVFSLVRQAAQLGFLPRMPIIHTNPDVEGQIYIPTVNFLLAVGAVSLVLVFQSSSALTAAYGIAVTGTMLITSIVLYFVLRNRWKWSRWKAGLFCGFFCVVDLVFFSSNMSKVADGGWFPLALATVLLVVMATWKRAKEEIVKILDQRTIEPEMLIKSIVDQQIVRTRGTAVYMTGRAHGVPPVLLHHLKSMFSLNKNVILLSVTTVARPRVDVKEELNVESLGEGFYRVQAKCGFMQSPDAMEILGHLREQGLAVNPMQTTFYFGREVIYCDGKSPLHRWQKRLYDLLSRMSTPAYEYYRVPANAMVEMGIPIQL